MSSSLFTPSHDCRCTNAILRKHVCSLSSFGGSDTPTGCGSFYTLHSFTGRWWCVEKALHQISAGSRCPSFCCLLDVLTSHDIASNLRSSRQRTLPQSDSTSFDQRGNRSEETTNSRLSTGMYWTWSKRVVTISPCLPVIGTIRRSGAILSPTMRGSTMLE